jgi:lipoprotein-anchoring transpeptidase ErfK/SrfK
MTDELERRLRDAFDAQARASVGDAATPPPARYLQPAKPHRVRRLAPLAAAAAVVAVGASVLALQGSPHARHPVAQHSAGRTSSAPVGTPAVRIKTAIADGHTYGVGMPVVAFFSRRFPTARPLAAATSVTVDGKPVRAAWYFERSSLARGYPVEGHLRMQTYWPAHSTIHVVIAPNDVTTGASVDFRTGAQTIAVVDDIKHRMSVTMDGKWLGSYPVALGANNTPTRRGTKVIMQKGTPVCMSGPGYAQCGIKYTQRLTYGGEYLHAAPWNTWNIEHGVDSSNGCTNLLPTDAARLYQMLNVGDVVEYPNVTGPTMRLGEGYGDWNVAWRVWLTGGLIPTS